jgi:mono/diheme cytochrome c family protein
MLFLPQKVLFYSTFLIITAFLTTTIAKAQSKPWIAPVAAQNIKNPIEASLTVVKEGKVLYSSNCAPCHGEKGKGDGPAAAALNPKPADHTSSSLLAETDGSLFWKISEGRTPMPQYKKMFTETQRWNLVNYIRTLSIKRTK